MLNFKLSKFKNFMSDFILKTSYVFTLIVFIFSLIGVLFAGSDMKISALPCTMLLWTILFSVFVSLINMFCAFINKKISNAVLQYSLHFILCYIAFLIVYVFGGGASAYLNETAATNLALKIIVMTLIFVGIYVVITLIKIAYTLIKNKLLNKNSSYERIYTEIDNPTDN